MHITRQDVVNRLSDYLHHRLTVAQLVDWAEAAMQEGEFETEGFESIRNAVARIGLADVRTFGLNWEDCEELLGELGFEAHVEIVAA